MNPNEVLWTEKYRPDTIEECILPSETYKTLRDFISTGILPNMLFSGSSGIGKTTVAHAIGKQLGYDVLYINASNEGRSIDILRGLLTDFASSMSLYSNRKLVILDEFDGVGSVVQDALRAFVELYSVTCSFILTCNHKHKLSSAIQSRFSDINFTIPSTEKKNIAVAFMKRIVYILDKENIKYDKNSIVELVKKYFPDFRRTLIELQRYSSSGEFSADHLQLLNADIHTIIQLLKDKNFDGMVATIEKISSIDINAIASELYNMMSTIVKPNSTPILVKILAEFIDKATRTTNPKITAMSMMTEIMLEVEML